MPKLFNFSLEHLVFVHLAFQESVRNPRLLTHALRCEHVRVGNLVVAVFKIAGLQPALIHQRFEAVVGLAEAYPHSFGQLALADVGLLFYEIEEFVGGFFVHVGFVREPARSYKELSIDNLWFRHATAIPCCFCTVGRCECCLAFARINRFSGVCKVLRSIIERRGN